MIKKKILITGASGFLGRNLILKLSRHKNFKIYGLITKNKISKKIKGVNYIICDILKLNQLKKKISKNYEIVINFAGNINHKNISSTKKIHYSGLKNLVHIFQKNKSTLFVQIGSSLEYGIARSPVSENFYCRPKSIYGQSKFKATNYVKKKINKFIILRLFQIYGPYQKKNRLIPMTISACLKNNSFPCTYGSQSRDFLYVDDFVDLIIKIIKKKQINKGIYNVGFGKPHKVKKIINLIKNEIKKGNPIFGKIKMRKDETKILYPSISKICKNFNWKPRTNILKGIKKTIRYYKK